MKNIIIAENVVKKVWELKQLSDTRNDIDIKSDFDCGVEYACNEMLKFIHSEMFRFTTKKI